MFEADLEPTYRESMAAFIADQLRAHHPPIPASDIVRYIDRWHELRRAGKAPLYRIERQDA